MQIKKLVSIVTINYNGYKDTCELIESLKAYISIPYELIVVDNASSNNEAQLLIARYGNEIKVVRSSSNLGFSGGNNLGIKNSCGEYVLLLNNDTIVEDDTFHHLIERLESDPKIGVVSPKIKFAFAPRNIQFAGYTPLSPLTIRNELIGFNCPDDDRYATAIETPYTHGAAMMLKRAVIDEVGLMPELFFLYYEELDWCTQISNKGWKLWYEPRCTVFHKESSTTGQDSPLKIKYMTRNRLLYTKRNRKGAEKFISLTYQICVAIPKNVLFHLLKGEKKQAKAALIGCIDYFKLNRK